MSEVPPNPKVYYRADKRTFETGKEILSAGEYVAKHTGEGKKVEELLDGSKFAKCSRKDFLFVFADETCARDHWCKMTNGKLYEVSVDDTDTVHRADMKLVDQLGKSLGDQDACAKIVKEYWAGTLTDVPCIEVLVTKATVQRELGSETERKAHVKKRFGVIGISDYPDDQKDDDLWYIVKRSS